MAIVNIIPETLADTMGPITPEAANKWADDNGTWIKAILDKHNTWLDQERIPYYQQLYDGFMDNVEQRDKNRGDDVNNKLMASYAQLIIDTVTDYLTGQHISWNFDDPDQEATEEILTEYRKAILGVFKADDAQRTIAEQLRQGSIAGYSGVISWVNERGQIQYDEFPTQELVPIYDTRGRLQLVLRPYTIELQEDPDEDAVERTRVEVYDGRYITYYISTDEEADFFQLDDTEIDVRTGEGNPIEHKAGRIPVSIFVNGTPARYEKRTSKNGSSDLGNGVDTILENYAAVMSDKANTVDRLLDQYLLLVGVKTDEEEVVKMRKARALKLKGDKSTSDARFISQTQEDTSVENHLDRLRETMHDMTFTPRLSDISGQTATEIKVKYANLDIKAGKKELYLTAAIRDFVEIITDMLNYKRLLEAGVSDPYAVIIGEVESSITLYKAEWITHTFNRNMPQNFKEIAEIVGMLVDKVPDEYLYDLIWFIDDPQAALEEMKKQRKERGDEQARQQTAGLFPPEFNDPGTGE